MEILIDFLKTLNELSPLAVIGLLGTVIFLLVKGKTAGDDKLNTIATNHLHDLPAISENMEKLVDSIQKVEGSLQRIEVLMSGEFNYLKAKLNGK